MFILKMYDRQYIYIYNLRLIDIQRGVVPLILLRWWNTIPMRVHDFEPYCTGPLLKKAGSYSILLSQMRFEGLARCWKKVDAWTVACHPQCWKASPWCVHSSVATHFICITSPEGSSPGWCCLIGINVSLLSFLIDRLVTSIYKSTYTGCFENLPLQAEEWERAAPASEPAAFRSPHPLSSSKIITAASQQKWQLPTPHQVRKQLQPASARKVRGKLKTCARFRTNSMNRCKQEFLL